MAHSDDYCRPPARPSIHSSSLSLLIVRDYYCFCYPTNRRHRIGRTRTVALGRITFVRSFPWIPHANCSDPLAGRPTTGRSALDPHHHNQRHHLDSLEIIIIIFRQGLCGGLLNFLFVLQLGGFIQLCFRWLQGGRFNKVQLIVATEFLGQPEEGFFKIIIGLGGNIIILQIFFAMKGNLFGLDLAILDFDLVSAQDNGDIVTDAGQIAVPVGDIFVGNATGNIKHDNGALTLNVITIPQASELFLTGRVPDVELNGSAIGKEGQGMDFDTERRDVFLFKFTGQMSLDKGRFADTTIADQNEFEFRYTFLRL